MNRIIAAGMLVMLFAGYVMAEQATDTGIVKRIGYLADDVMQHPIIPSPLLEKEREQFYFDVGDKDKPDSMLQIIVTYPAGMKIPTERGRKIELTSVASVFSLGGKPETKGEYKNEALSLQNWKYLGDAVKEKK